MCIYNYMIYMHIILYVIAISYHIILSPPRGRGRAARPAALRPAGPVYNVNKNNNGNRYDDDDC